DRYRPGAACEWPCAPEAGDVPPGRVRTAKTTPPRGAARATMKFSTQEFAYILAALQAEERATDAADRRRHSRIDIGIVIQVVDVATQRTYSAMTRDISFTGISIVQSSMPTLNSYVIIQLPRRRQKFDAV